MPLSSGSKLGPYEIIAPIGAGGMGEVYRARDAALDRDVAVKVLPAAFSEDGDRLRRFKQEAQAATALNHPNILTIFHVGEFNGTPYIVSELLGGETLRERLVTGPLPVRKAIDYAGAVFWCDSDSQRLTKVVFGVHSYCSCRRTRSSLNLGSLRRPSKIGWAFINSIPTACCL
jgi:serine/threonine protein kinase